MNQTLKITDIVAVGFMLFAFFLGAGNIIFPPLAGQLAGDNVLSAMSGFLITAVGLPLISIIAVALAGGTWEHLTKDLPVKLATSMAALIFIVIGPMFATPRTGLVAFEMAVKPLFSNPDNCSLGLFSGLFFFVAASFSWVQGKLIDYIGKFLTPILFIGLIIVAAGVLLSPQGSIMAAKGDYVAQPLMKGFLEGYNTMDTFAALMFGMLMVDALKGKGITQTKATTRYLIMAACIAASGLAFVYVSLFYLGSTSLSIAGGADNGGIILSLYVQALFGPSGQLVLSMIVLLACLTTAIGLISSCSDYFCSLTPLSYRAWVLINSVTCAVVANIGLNQLIALSIPVLFALYPVAIALVMLTFLRPLLPNPHLAYRIVLSVSFLFALVDAGRVVGLDVSVFRVLPLFDMSMGWLLPTIVTLVVMFFLPRGREPMAITEVAGS